MTRAAAPSCGACNWAVGARAEVAALKERLHGAEAERNRLRDENEELRADEDERRELRRRMNTAEEAAGGGKKIHSLVRVFLLLDVTGGGVTVV